MRLLLILLTVAELSAQIPRIGAIEYYGQRRITIPQIQTTLKLKAGDPLPVSKAELEGSLESLPSVVEASLEAVCCDQGKALLYVGIREQDAPRLQYRPAPEAAVSLPSAIGDAYLRFLRAISDAAKSGQTAEDLTRGHSLLQHEQTRLAQQAFVPLAQEHLEVLRDVLRRAKDEEQRAMAAYIIGYHPDKKSVVPDLDYALLDIDETVRAHALRALTAVAVYANRHPEQALTLPSDPMIVLLHSPAWQERNNAAHYLVSLTESRNAALLQQVGQRARQPLREMARWSTPAHSLPACLLLGRIAGLPESEIESAWNRGDKDKLLGVVRAAPAKKR